MKEKSAENVVWAYLWGIFGHKEGSVAILSDNGREFKTLTSIRHVINSALEEYFLTCFTTKATQELEMCAISSREHLLNF